MDLKEFKQNIRETKTKGIIKLVTFVLLLLLFVLVWLFCGDINLGKLNWLFSPNTDNPDPNGYINLNIIYVWLGCAALTILLFLLLKFVFKIVNYDLIPFLVFPIIAGLMLIVTAFIPFNSKNSGWIGLARFIITAVTAIIFFWIAILITNKFLINSNQAAYIYEDIKKEYQEISKIKNETKQYIKKKPKRETIEI
ncbi:MAG: hypothetical protein HUJ42_03425 [Malacoplasma sp.]|nr:hypothetical protein [Malacoplasma sp.]